MGDHHHRRHQSASCPCIEMESKTSMWHVDYGCLAERGCSSPKRRLQPYLAMLTHNTDKVKVNAREKIGKVVVGKGNVVGAVC
jgi:hypothetical protein